MLNIAFIWHMHQPLYKDRINNAYLMPWVRLHGIKDYLDMAIILEKFPNLSQTFNLVPSLIEQLEDYVEGKAKDPYWKLSKIPVNKLSIIQKAKILELFFDLTWDKMIYKFPRYFEILQKREYFLKINKEFVSIAKEFSEQEILDLSVWFNIAWFDYLWQNEAPELIRLIKKGRYFTEEDRKIVLNKQIEIIKRIIPEYKKLLKLGKVEIITSPYYHPILPLLCNSDSAKIARPEINLPWIHYHYPEDAFIQIKKGIDKHINCFGRRPSGMWPSEHSVSPEILPALVENKIKWIVSDEGILFHSLGYFPHRDSEQLFTEPAVLYQPYLLEQSGRKITIIFRDIYLSDAIGFMYSKMDPFSAAEDLYNRLKAIQQRLPDNYPYLVTIALDGENCWEHYVNDGHDFLNHFYEMVSNDSSLNMTSVNKYLEEHPPQKVLTNLFSGSWIRSDFTTWIGDPAKNKAWDYLYIARKELENYQINYPEQKDVLDKAWEEIYISEGSDWFWWFGKVNSSSHDDLFDWQFRLHLQNVYRLINEDIPDYLNYPLYDIGQVQTIPDALFKEGWIDTHIYDFGSRTGTMHQSGKVFEKVYYGHDQNNFRLRIDFSELFQFSASFRFEIYIWLEDKIKEKPVLTEDLKLQLNYSANLRININFDQRNYQIFSFNPGAGWQKTTELNDMIFTKDFINLKIAFPLIHLDKNEKFTFVIIAYKNSVMEEAINEPIEYQVIS